MPAIWAISDLHLSFGTPNKSMDIFGSRWVNHAERVRLAWSSQVASDDLVLIAGDISWAKLLTEAAVDLEWIHRLPGKKVLLKGNHDYWWGSLSGVSKILPPSMTLIQNNSYQWENVAIGGARLWDTKEYSFEDYVDVTGAKDVSLQEPVELIDTEKIFVRELHRLELSLKALNPNAAYKIAMTHYPPIGANLEPSRVSKLLERYGVSICVFGHIHNVPPGRLPFGIARGVHYFLTACDYLECQPLKILDIV